MHLNCAKNVKKMHETACKTLILLYNIIRKWEKVGMIYFGTYQHSLDAKNRLLIPSKLKALLTSTVYIMKGFDGCLSVFDHNSFQNYVEKLQKYSLEKQITNATNKRLYSIIIYQQNNTCC